MSAARRTPERGKKGRQAFRRRPEGEINRHDNPEPPFQLERKALFPYFDAVSLREPVSTSLENALIEQRVDIVL
jgi:hypothetical protein